MNLFPFVSETLVSGHSKDDILQKLSLATDSIDYMDRRFQADNGAVFHGKITNKGFIVSKIIQKANTFLPLLSGKIEQTPRGSIIFLKYRLFPGAVFFLIFWSVILIGFAFFLLGISGEIFWGIGCLGAAILNYLLTLVFFNRQLKDSRKSFFDVIGLALQD